MSQDELRQFILKVFTFFNDEINAVKLTIANYCLLGVIKFYQQSVYY